MPQRAVFTKREILIIQLICKEKTSAEIAGKLKLSARTVEEHRQKIKTKIRAKSTIGVVLYAIRHKLVSI